MKNEGIKIRIEIKNQKKGQHTSYISPPSAINSLKHLAVRNIRSELCSFPFQFRYLRKAELCAWTNPYTRNSWKSVERQIRRYLEIQVGDADIKSPIQIPIKISALSLSSVPYLTTQILTGDFAKITFFIIFIQ